MEKITEKLFTIRSNRDFEEVALKIFQFQASRNLPYKKYMSLLGIDPSRIKKPEEIPFLPVRFFKSQKVSSCKGSASRVFLSSGTTTTEPSKHYIYDLTIYEQSFLRSFRMNYGDPENYIILALLPSYLERSGSSLIYMVKKLIDLTGSSHSGFYLHDHEKLYKKLLFLSSRKVPVILFGVSYALLDFARQYTVEVPGMVVMETGGMKGRGEEMVRQALHRVLMKRLHVKTIHSEYGMTELLSQAYSAGKGLFTPPPWMKIFIRDPYDPFSLLPAGRHGGINIIDLANIYSCSFIATSDLGVAYHDGSFSVLGRFDHSELRGCNLMVQEI